jgi:hypothetical protein
MLKTTGSNAVHRPHVGHHEQQITTTVHLSDQANISGMWGDHVLTIIKRMVQCCHYLPGGPTTMDAIDQALAQVRSEIERIRQYLAQLQETERELAMLQESRQVIAQQWSAPPTQPASGGILSSASPVASAEIPRGPIKRGMQPTLSMDILQLLKSTGRPMAPIEIDAELRKRGRDMHVNAVTSGLSRLLKSQLVIKDESAKYALATSLARVEGNMSVSPTSLAGQAYVVLKKVGRPLTGKQITEYLQSEGHQVNPRSVITALYHYAQDGQLFRRVGSKTFGLLEWEAADIQPTTALSFLGEDEYQAALNEPERDGQSPKENNARQDDETPIDATYNNNGLDGISEI